MKPEKWSWMVFWGLLSEGKQQVKVNVLLFSTFSLLLWKENHDNAECLASFSDSTHKNVNTNLIIIFPAFFFPILHVFHHSASFPTKFFSLKIKLCFHYFCDYAKVIWEKIFYKSFTHLFYFSQYSRKLELVTATSMKLSFCKCFKCDFQAVWLLIEFWV